MSRIRSIHPGLFTDEAFMSLSMGARLLLIGIWTEAFDDGVFRWKPLTLKARIFPVDSVDVASLLAEIEAAGCIMRADDGIGLVRNFQKFQRPKKPNQSGLLRPEWHDFVGASSAKSTPDDDDGSEPVPHQFPTSSEKSPQMEDGGGNKEDGEEPPVAPQGGGAGDLFDQVWEAFPRNPTSNEGRAEAVFRATKAKDQTAILAAAQRYSRWFTEECERRKKPRDERLSFVPHLGTWIETGAWRSAGDLPLKAENATVVVPMVKLDRVADAALWAACERLQGKRAPTSDNNWHFRADLVTEAKAMVLQ